MPIPVATRPRFKCQFCLSYRATIHAVTKHEGVCFQNPDRFCPLCKNTGRYEVDAYGDPPFSMEQWEDCHYCSKEDKELTAAKAQAKRAA